MMFKRYKRIILVPLLLCMTLLKAQDILEINNNRIVNPGETMSINAGTLVKMGPGAVLDVRGSLYIKGTVSNPVRFVNVDPFVPAMGIQISGIESEGVIDIKGLEFSGLIQPLRFDPFWYRKVVDISNTSIRYSTSYEPIIYVASPFIDLRDGKKIKFNFNQIDVVNNASGILVEAYGSNGIQHNFDKIYFGDNVLMGGDASLGLLHLDFSTSNTIATPNIGDLAFERNVANDNPIGLSVSGSSSQSVSMDGIYGDDPAQLIFDQKNDIRIPSVSIKKTGTLSDFGKSDYIKSVIHNFGDLKMIMNGNLEIKELRDGEGNKVEINRSLNADTQTFEYIQGLPTTAILTDGTNVKLPTVIPDQVTAVKVTKIDTAEFNKFKKLSSQLTKDHDSSDKVKVQFSFTIPTFAKKGEIVNKQRLWEVGIWGGGAIYGGGDIKHRRASDYASAPAFVKSTPGVRSINVFSTIEISGGLYGQYNYNSRFSLRGTFYFSKVSVWNVIAPGLFAKARDIQTFDQDFNKIYTNAYPNWFVTQMYNAEVEALWHLVPYQLREGKKFRIIPTLGLSLGVFHYTPYRYTWDPTFPGQKWEDYKFKPEKHSLRKLGSEGQYFLPGAKPYNTMAANIGSSFQLAFLTRKWAFKGEMKFVYTSTDYLDDFGPGIWYGGDINRVRDNHQLEDITPHQLGEITKSNGNISKSAYRSTDGLNDWYYQAHLGFSYFLFSK